MRESWDPCDCGSMCKIVVIDKKFVFQGVDDEASSMDSKLTDEDKMDCAKVIQGYLGGRVRDPIVSGLYM